VDMQKTATSELHLSINNSEYKPAGREAQYGPQSVFPMSYFE